MMIRQMVFTIFAGVILSIILVLPFMRAPVQVNRAELEETLGEILRRAFKDPG